MKKSAQPQYLLRVKFLDGNSEYEGFAPRESIRIKMKGGGLNFVHGGISLQEMVVPAIEYHFLRNDSKEYKRNRSQYNLPQKRSRTALPASSARFTMVARMDV